MKDPTSIIIRPHITERSVSLSYGDERAAAKRQLNEARKSGSKAAPAHVQEEELVRKYTFIVARDANKIEIKQAVESLYNEGKKPAEAIKVEKVHTVRVKGKKKRRTMKSSGYTPDRKKAIVTLAKGQMLEDYGV
ncbi:MAG TPA: 50S ribosomal protein L23 [Fimbriimonadaceae bacterium]|nr:50S ribosomal protein L23 [Fimbriimonadaceae bacterium]